jgi:hypothetical protein
LNSGIDQLLKEVEDLKTDFRSGYPVWRRIPGSSSILMILYDLQLAVARSQGNVKNVFDDFHYSNWESSIIQAKALRD